MVFDNRKSVWYVEAMTIPGELYAVATAFLWAGSALVFASLTKRTSSIHVNVLRLIVGEAYLVCTVLAMPRTAPLSSSQHMYLIGSGVVGLALGDSFLFRAYQEIGARVTMLLMALAPAFGALLAAVALDERLGAMTLLGMAVTIVGIGIVVLEVEEGARTRLTISAFGLAMGLLAAFGQGCGLVLAKLAFREGAVNGFLASAWRIAGGLAFLVPVAWSTGRLRGIRRETLADKRTIGLLLLASVLGPYLGIAASLEAVAATSVGVSSTIMATVPIIMLPLAWLIYRERIHVKPLIGAVVAVGGVSILFLG